MNVAARRNQMFNDRVASRAVTQAQAVDDKQTRADHTYIKQATLDKFKTKLFFTCRPGKECPSPRNVAARDWLAPDITP